MTVKAGEIIARFGGQSALARSLGVNQSTVQHWAKTGQIPSWRREQVLRAAEEHGIRLGLGEGGGNGFGGGFSSASPAPAAPPVQPARVAVPHGRAEFIPNVETEIGQLRDEIAQLRTLLERLVADVAALREGREDAGGEDAEKRGRYG